MTKEVVTVAQVITTYSDKFKETPIAQALIKHGKEKLADKIISNFYFMCRKNASDVAKWTPDSVVEALTKCCQWELVPDGIQAALVVYKTKDEKGNKRPELTFQPMYQGLLEVAYRTGIFKSISANIVYEGDLFEYDLGSDCYVKHQLDLKGPRDKPLAVYADVRLANGGRIVQVMTMKEINKIKNAARSKKVWDPYFDQMAVKTVIKRTFKHCPKSEDLSSLVAYDNSLEQDFDKGPDTAKATALNNLLGVKPADQLPEPSQDQELDDVDLDFAIEAENNVTEG